MAGDLYSAPSDTGFQVVRRGYDQAQVDAHLRRLDAEIRILTSDRDGAVGQAGQLVRELDDARARAERLRTQVRQLSSPPQTVQGMSERMRSMLRLAEDEVADMLARAEDQSKRRIEAAKLEAEQIVAGAHSAAAQARAQAVADAQAAAHERAEQHTRLEAEFDRRVAEAEREAEQILASARSAAAHERAQATADAQAAAHERAEQHARLEAERHAASMAIVEADAEAQLRRDRAWADSEARRALVEEDFTLAMNQRRSEAIEALAKERLDAKKITEEARRTAAEQVRIEISKAQERAKEIIGGAERDVTELTALRSRLAEQLDGIRGELDRAIAGLVPPRAEITTGGDAAVASEVAPEIAPEPVPSPRAPETVPTIAGQKPSPGQRPAQPSPAQPSVAPRPAGETAPAPAAKPGEGDPAQNGNGSNHTGQSRRRTRKRPNATTSGRR